MKISKSNISEWDKLRSSQLKETTVVELLPKTPGAYVIFYKAKPKGIRRLGSEDRQKIFYIGQTKNVRKRLYDF